MKKILVFMFLLISAITLSACETTEEPNPDLDKDIVDEQLELTIEELAMYDGKDGMDAYIAVDGVVYDVTDVAAWNGGSHNGGMAGTDVSELINSAPHGDRVLDDLDIIGSIVD